MRRHRLFGLTYIKEAKIVDWAGPLTFDWRVLSDEQKELVINAVEEKIVAKLKRYDIRDWHHLDICVFPGLHRKRDIKLRTVSSINNAILIRPSMTNKLGITVLYEVIFNTKKETRWTKITSFLKLRTEKQPLPES